MPNRATQEHLCGTARVDPSSTRVPGTRRQLGVPTSESGTPDDPWLEGRDFEPLDPRDVQRFPLGRYVRAALAIVEDALTGAGRREAQRILLRSGIPAGGVEPEWYAQLKDAALEIKKQGRSAVNEIAKQKGVSANVVNQWLHRAHTRH